MPAKPSKRKAAGAGRWSEAQIERARLFAIRKFLLPKHPDSAPRLRNADPRHNVVAVGVARKRTANRDQTAVGITFYVRHKISDPAAVPTKFRLPRQIYGIPTDVLEAGEPAFLFGRRHPSWPARPGALLLVRQPNGMEQVGTYGALVEDENGRRYILSNNHVLADFDRNPPGTRIFQPGRPFQIARLRVTVPLDPFNPNDTDCALARIGSGAHARASLAAPAGPLFSGTPTAATLGMRVAKRGAASGTTAGRVQSPTLAVDLGGFHFDNLIQVEDEDDAFCDHGDSGALLVDEATHHPVALLIGRMGHFNFACSLDRVLARLSAALGSALRILVSP